MLSRIIMISATLEILYSSQVEFKDRLEAQGVQVDWKKIDGLHQVKDMSQTEAGREAKRYITDKTGEVVKRIRNAS